MVCSACRVSPPPYGIFGPVTDHKINKNPANYLKTEPDYFLFVIVDNASFLVISAKKSPKNLLKVI